jgi:hypothetical protein
MAYIDKGKHESDLFASKSDEVAALIDGTTIQGTVDTNFICPLPVWLSSSASVAEKAPHSMPGWDLPARQRNHPGA